MATGPTLARAAPPKSRTPMYGAVFVEAQSDNHQTQGPTGSTNPPHTTRMDSVQTPLRRLAFQCVSPAPHKEAPQSPGISCEDARRARD